MNEIASAGRLIRLTPQSMRLLLYLATHRDRVIGLQELLEEVWPGVIVTPQSVYSCVAQLRQTLGDSSEAPTYIVTVARKGYRLTAAVEECVLQEPSPLPIVTGAENISNRESVSHCGEATLARRSGLLSILRLKPAITSGACVVILLGLGAMMTHHSPVESVMPGPKTVMAVAGLPSKQSIAVLPFVDMSASKDQEYFADGLAEEIVDRLSSIPELKVAARTSAFSFKGKFEDVRTIAQKLLVANILEGSVQKNDSRLRVTAQLVDAETGYHLWSTTYDRQLASMFEVQDEIAAAVAKALTKSLVANPTAGTRVLRNVDANDLYLRALFHFWQLSNTGAEEANKLLDRALALDPNFTGAWALLARVKMTLAQNRSMPAEYPAKIRRDARAAAETAVGLDPRSPDAHIALGRIYMYDYVYSREYVPTIKARAEFDRALELNSGSADATLQLAIIAGDDGNRQEQIQLGRRALEMDPLNVNVLQVVGSEYLYNGRADIAERIFRRMSDISPDNRYTGDSLGLALDQLHRSAEALTMIDASPMDDDDRRWWHAFLYPAVGRATEADALIRSLERFPGSNTPASLAMLYVRRGDAKRALNSLERQYRVDPAVLREALRYDLLYGKLRDEPRYRVLIQKLHLPQPQIRGDVPMDEISL